VNKRVLWTLIPLVAFAVLVAFLAVGLKRDPREVPSPLVNKPAPQFSLPQLQNPALKFSPEQMKGQVWLLNVWASWCVSCREEHPVLLEMARSKQVPVVGLDYKDKAEDGKKWLDGYGNPYLLSAQDLDGRVGINYGVYGVPETYLIDREGIIRYKQIGPITREIWTSVILPKVAELSK
jgi:cytochrome c biogenesis protein CcmG/thiol:disulfide interchange protein DsbE